METHSNTYLWPIIPFGGEDEKANENSGSDNSGQSGGQSNNAGNQGNSNQNQNSSSEDDEDDPYKGLTTKELKRLLKDTEGKAETTESERKALQDKIDADERAKLSTVEQKDRTIAEHEQTISNLRASLAQQAIINAINDDKRYAWNSAAIVAQQLDPEKVKVDDKGKVSGIEKELTRIATAESTKFLLAKDNTQQDNNNNNNQDQQSNNGPSGFQPGQGGANSSGNGVPENAAELAKLMPALNSRL